MNYDADAKHVAELRAAAKLLNDEAQKLASETAEAKSPLELRFQSIAEKVLGGNLGIEELQRLQTETNVLETLMTAATNYHHHDTNEHHDHQTYVLDPGVFQVRREKI